ncbi:MAG: hypothetical protein KJO40_00010 [Deltaproteobacteria bacterium]|nr:hypothetical protein [Deltaproteobacteria bacterium]NND28192.1 hypothetical protein [Myxococcales bacterium]MBT8464280.1 hypothetical protein [Deltaproteobacteria bacterium]MBT8483298.1 hypothetical protein [Deltaproteobacteria bacterium]NNK07462.1 hypothetical protein [Myxococcales bacterium]
MSTSAAANKLQMTGPASERLASRSTMKVFWTCTALVWGGVGVCAALFFVGVLGFTTSAKIGLYAISIWLNVWVLVFLLPQNKGRPKLDLYHDALVVWMLSYMLTNALWEIPWVLFSPFVFENLHTLDDVVAQTDFMRESVVHMYWWVLASFSSVDLRTVNHNSTFYTLELYAFVNVLTVIYFFYLNRKRSRYRYLIPVLGCGEPVASTFIFSFSEVFGGFENMSGGVADTLLALVWTQYQYFLFPLIFGYFGVKLLMADWRH